MRGCAPKTARCEAVISDLSRFRSISSEQNLPWDHILKTKVHICCSLLIKSKTGEFPVGSILFWVAYDCCNNPRRTEMWLVRIFNVELAARATLGMQSDMKTCHLRMWKNIIAIYAKRFIIPRSCSWVLFLVFAWFSSKNGKIRSCHF